MLNIKFEHIFIKEQFILAYEEISSKASGLDEVSYDKFESNLYQIF
jgi:hypothetical protein